MGAAECTTLAFEKECDHLVNITNEVKALNMMEVS
jgi:hypothetical protein